MATISDFGITVSVPSNWHGEVFRLTDGLSDSGPIVHVANTPLILGDESGYATVTRQTMRVGDVILCVLNMPSLRHLVNAQGVEQVGNGRRWSLVGASETPFNAVSNGQSSLRKAIRVGERIFDVIAFFGTPTPDSGLRNELDAILGTVRVDRVPPKPGARIEQYFSISAAVQIQEEVGREIWERDSRYATNEEREEHARAFPNG